MEQDVIPTLAPAQDPAAARPPLPSAFSHCSAMPATQTSKDGVLLLPISSFGIVPPTLENLSPCSRYLHQPQHHELVALGIPCFRKEQSTSRNPGTSPPCHSFSAEQQTSTLR